MNFASIKKCDVANGIGVRVSLFVSGCTHHCKNCFNEEAWDFGYGKPFTKEDEKEVLKLLEPSYISGLSLLGGEPLEPCNQLGLITLLRNFKKQYPNKTLWCYSGYTFEYITNTMFKTLPYTKEILSYVDVLVDGKYVDDLKDLKLRFRGSSNQRIIDVKKSLKENKIILWEEV